MKSKKVDYVVVGCGPVGAVVSELLLQSQKSFIIIATDSNPLNDCKLKDNSGLADLDDISTRLQSGNLTTWGGRVSLFGLQKEHKQYENIISGLDFVSSVFGINLPDNLNELHVDDSDLKCSRLKFTKRQYLREGQISDLASLRDKKIQYRNKNGELEVIEFRKHAFFCTGHLSALKLILNNYPSLKKLYFSGHLSGNIGRITLNKNDAKYFAYMKHGNGFVRSNLNQYLNLSNDSVLFSVNNLPMHNHLHNSFSLSLLYLVLRNRFFRSLVNKPLLSKNFVSKVAAGKHLKNLRYFRMDDVYKLSSLIYQKFVLRRRNPVALFTGASSTTFDVHVHLPLSQDAGTIERIDTGYLLSLNNTKYDHQELTQAVENLVLKSSEIGIGIELNQHYHFELQNNSRDGYHQMGSDCNYNLPKSISSNMTFLTTGTLNDGLPHFPTFAACCCAVSIVRELILEE